MTAEERQEIMDLHAQGLGQIRISRRVKWCSRTIFKVLRDSGVPRMSQVKGEQHYAAKLKEENVREIRASSLPKWDLARKFDVSWSVINDVQTFRSWKHVT